MNFTPFARCVWYTLHHINKDDVRGLLGRRVRAPMISTEDAPELLLLVDISMEDFARFAKCSNRAPTDSELNTSIRVQYKNE